MEHTAEQKGTFKTQFALRRRKQIILAIPLIAVIVLLVSSEGKDSVLGMPLTVAGPGAVIVILAGLAFSLYNWRCPACKKYLGKAISPKFCAGCGEELS